MNAMVVVFATENSISVSIVVVLRAILLLSVLFLLLFDERQLVSMVGVTLKATLVAKPYHSLFMARGSLVESCLQGVV